ncbi:protein IMPACT-A-like isoform X2 [Oscarella lobularis]|uniref:protein IMPACT-A-like isoform X2 n=1 Tax=Oscarella lobularis TaxID=121494 RepID=UPI0033144126
MSNEVKQKEELEVLTSIYANEWKTVDEANQIYEIEISDSKVRLQVILPTDYPSRSAPVYQIHVDCELSHVRPLIASGLDQIYEDAEGEPVLFQWVEWIREFFESRKEASSSTPSATQSHSADSDEEIAETAASDYQNRFRVVEAASVVCPPISHGQPLVDRKSTFQAHLAPIHSTLQVQIVIDHLLENSKIAHATHNINAYRFFDETKRVWIHGCDDDGESAAGSRLLHLLQILQVENVLVIVSRWYGGIHLGPDRFKHINNCARDLLQHCGYIKSKDSKHKKKKGKASRS